MNSVGSEITWVKKKYITKYNFFRLQPPLTKNKKLKRSIFSAYVHLKRLKIRDDKAKNHRKEDKVLPQKDVINEKNCEEFGSVKATDDELATSELERFIDSMEFETIPSPKRNAETTPKANASDPQIQQTIIPIKSISPKKDSNEQLLNLTLSDNNDSIASFEDVTTGNNGKPETITKPAITLIQKPIAAESPTKVSEFIPQTIPGLLLGGSRLIDTVTVAQSSMNNVNIRQRLIQRVERRKSQASEPLKLSALKSPIPRLPAPRAENILIRHKPQPYIIPPGRVSWQNLPMQELYSYFPSSPYYGPPGVYPRPQTHIPVRYLPVPEPTPNCCYCAQQKNASIQSQTQCSTFQPYQSVQYQHPPMIQPQINHMRPFETEPTYFQLPVPRPPSTISESMIPNESGMITQHFRHNNSFSGGLAAIPPPHLHTPLTLAPRPIIQITAAQTNMLPIAATYSGNARFNYVHRPNVIMGPSIQNIPQTAVNDRNDSIRKSSCTQTEDSSLKLKPINNCSPPKLQQQPSSILNKNRNLNSKNEASLSCRRNVSSPRINRINMKSNPLLNNLLFAPESTESNQSSEPCPNDELAITINSMLESSSTSKKASKQSSKVTFHRVVDSVEAMDLDITPIVLDSLFNKSNDPEKLQMSPEESHDSPQLSPRMNFTPSSRSTVISPQISTVQNCTTANSSNYSNKNLNEDNLRNFPVAESIEQIEEYINMDLLQELTDDLHSPMDDVEKNRAFDYTISDHNYSKIYNDRCMEEISVPNTDSLDCLFEKELGDATVENNNTSVETLNLDDSPKDATVHRKLSRGFLRKWGKRSQNNTENLELNQDRLTANGQLIPFRGLGKKPEIDSSISNAPLRGLDHHLVANFYAKFRSTMNSSGKSIKTQKRPIAKKPIMTKDCLVSLERIDSNQTVNQTDGGKNIRITGTNRLNNDQNERSNKKKRIEDQNRSNDQKPESSSTAMMKNRFHQESSKMKMAWNMFKLQNKIRMAVVEKTNQTENACKIAHISKPNQKQIILTETLSNPEVKNNKKSSPSVQINNVKGEIKRTLYHYKIPKIKNLDNPKNSEEQSKTVNIFSPNSGEISNQVPNKEAMMQMRESEFSLPTKKNCNATLQLIHPNLNVPQNETKDNNIFNDIDAIAIEPISTPASESVLPVIINEGDDILDLFPDDDDLLSWDSDQTSQQEDKIRCRTNDRK